MNNLTSLYMAFHAVLSSAEAPTSHYVFYIPLYFEKCPSPAAMPILFRPYFGSLLEKVTQ
jgi:hypothetical protein